MERISIIHSVGAMVRSRGERILARVQERTGVQTLGPISTDTTQRYARVRKDPEIIFADPLSDWKPIPPEYEVWIGNTLKESIRVLEALPFILTHEAMHVVAAKDEYRFPADQREAIIDRLALTDLGEPRIIDAMVGFSEMIWIDHQLKGLSCLAAACEMAKLKWAVQQPETPSEVKRLAANLYVQYPRLVNKAEARSLLNEQVQQYSQIFARPIEIPGISTR